MTIRQARQRRACHPISKKAAAAGASGCSLHPQGPARRHGVSLTQTPRSPSQRVGRRSLRRRHVRLPDSPGPLRRPQNQYGSAFPFSTLRGRSAVGASVFPGLGVDPDPLTSHKPCWANIIILIFRVPIQEMIKSSKMSLIVRGRTLP